MPEPQYLVEPLDSAHGTHGLFRGGILLDASPDAVYLQHRAGILNEWAESHPEPPIVVVDSPIG